MVMIEEIESQKGLQSRNDMTKLTGQGMADKGEGTVKASFPKFCGQSWQTITCEPSLASSCFLWPVS